MVQDTAATSRMDDTHSIIQFLERPVQIDHFELDTSSGDSTKMLKKIVTETANPQPYIRKYTLPSQIIKSGGKAQKMLNFKYFRADIKIKLVLNANPFVAGRFYLTYSPYEDQITAPRKQINSSRAGVTAYPGVEIDLQLDNSVEIEIPYASYREAYDLTRDDTDYVTLYLFALTEMLGPATGNTTRVDISIFAWFTNINLVIPTYMPLPDTYMTTLKERVVYQKAEVSQKDKDRLATARKIESLKKTNKTMYDYIMQIVGRTEEKHVSMQIQAESGKKGPITEIAEGIGAAAGAIGGIANKIPVIGGTVGTVTGVIKTIADIGAGIASIFGWSKPHDMDRVIMYAGVPAKGYAHYKGVDSGVPLALTSENELSMPSDVFPSRVDEMDLGYICKNPGVKAVINWSTNDSVGKPLNSNKSGGSSYDEGTQLVTIGTTASEKISVADANIVIADTVPCEYVSTLFTYWRATICFKISVVKTAFHTGRLEIVFDPNMYPRINNDSPIVDDNAIQTKDTTNNYRYILDLTNDTEVVIRIPYVSSKQFLSTQGLLDDGIDWNEYDFENTLTGCLYLRPLTKLLAPDTVADYVRVIVWKWAENVDLVCPKNGSNTRATIFEPISTSMKMKIQRLKAQMQINISNKADENVQTFFDASEDNTQALEHGCGEKMVNLRILLRTFRKFADSQPIQNQPIIMKPQDDSEKGRDYLSYLSYMYRFMRGGLRYKVFSDSNTTQQDAGVAVKSTLLRNGDGKTDVDIGPTHTTFPFINPIHEITVPFYSQYRKIPISLPVDKEFMTAAFSTSSGQTQASLYRAGSDDFTFGWLLGTPQLVIGRSVFNNVVEPVAGTYIYVYSKEANSSHNWFIIPNSYLTQTGKDNIVDHPAFRQTRNGQFRINDNPKEYVYEDVSVLALSLNTCVQEFKLPANWINTSGTESLKFWFNLNVPETLPDCMVSYQTHEQGN